ncbi:MAG TPA: hypothetical protein VNP53_09540 [Methylomirabilota bacterium]|nr:hypothetical protein [Methylomirabilota bacterium]
MALVLADACIAPADHEIHLADGVPIKGETANPLDSVPFAGRLRPSQSLAYIRCQVASLYSSSPCPPDERMAQGIWPFVKQRPKTLYIGLLPSCPGYFNIEYFAHDRRLIIHCHVAWPYISIPTGGSGVVAYRVTELIEVPTDPIGPGSLQVIEDDRVEHLIGDQTTETELGTATIT